MSPIYRGPKTHPKSRNTKKNTAFTRTFSKSSRELFKCDTSQEPNGNGSAKTVQMNFLFWVDFSGGFSSCESKVPARPPITVMNGERAKQILSPPTPYSEACVGCQAVEKGSPEKDTHYFYSAKCLKMAFLGLQKVHRFRVKTPI